MNSDIYNISYYETQPAIYILQCDIQESHAQLHDYVFQLTQGKGGVAISDIVLECSHSDYSLMFPFMLHCNYVPNTLHGTYACSASYLISQLAGWLSFYKTTIIEVFGWIATPCSTHLASLPAGPQWNSIKGIYQNYSICT